MSTILDIGLGALGALVLVGIVIRFFGSKKEVRREFPSLNERYSDDGDYFITPGDSHIQSAQSYGNKKGGKRKSKRVCRLKK